jgi:hypothetical protein
MRIITAPQNYNKQSDQISVFLAGGITNCPKWQNEVIRKLEDFELQSLVIYNPRQEHFDITNPNASYKQIAWEYQYLESMDIFSMYFSDGNSDQPICMYELGRNIIRMQNRFPNDWKERIVITCENGYRRKQDVYIQTRLATQDDIVYDSLDKHISAIQHCYQNLIKEQMNETDN